MASASNGIVKVSNTNLRAWIIWCVGSFAYVAAVFSRTSFGVAGEQAAERFNVSPSVLGLFVIVQMVVYAAMQIPSGLILDRVGSRLSMVGGTFVMGFGQCMLAFAENFWFGLGARVFIGAGDALIWMSAIRLIPAWFESRRVPLLTQISSMLGQVGQWASAVPLVAILTHEGWGWTPGFLVVAGCCFVSLLMNATLVRDTPPGVERPKVASKFSRSDLAVVLSAPGAWLGFFVHLATASTWLMFALMWGYNYLEQGQSRTTQEASWLFMVMIAGNLIVSPLIGVLTTKAGNQRTILALCCVATIGLAWALLLAFPPPAPGWVLVVFMTVIGVCSPASNIAFDLVRTFLPAFRWGTGNGFVVVGGFLGGLILVGVAGLVLSMLGHGQEAWRVAMLPVFVVLAVAVAGMLLTRRAAIKRQAAEQNR